MCDILDPFQLRSHLFLFLLVLMILLILVDLILFELLLDFIYLFIEEPSDIRFLLNQYL
jgi:hypothetical protein